MVGNKDIKSSQPIGVIIRNARKKRALSLARLASRAAISTNHLLLIEKGNANPGIEIATRICSQLGLAILTRNDEGDETIVKVGETPVSNE